MLNYKMEMFDSKHYRYCRVFKNKEILNNFLNNSSDDIIDYGEAIVFSKGNYSAINILSTIYDKGYEFNYSKIIKFDNVNVDIITSTNSSRSGKIYKEDDKIHLLLKGSLWRHKSPKNKDILQTYKKHKNYIFGKHYIIEDSKKILIPIDVFYKK